MLYIDEVFTSIQGESTSAGEPCIFVRLHGCPFSCSYCDQPQNDETRTRISSGNIVDRVAKHRWIKNVCITGGEPLIYDEVVPIAMELLHKGFKVSIETSGCIPITPCDYRRSYKYVMDIKCPSSGMQEKNVFNNLRYLQFNDEVKFVIKDKEDYEYMKKVLKKYRTSATILASPMTDKNGELIIGKKLVDWILRDKLNIRVSPQIHKYLNVK